MTRECGDALPIDDEGRLFVAELAELSGLTEAEILEFLEYGVLAPAPSAAGTLVFDVRSLSVARTARRLREDYDLEAHAVALLIAYLERIRELEAEVRLLRARLPG